MANAKRLPYSLAVAAGAHLGRKMLNDGYRGAKTLGSRYFLSGSGSKAKRANRRKQLSPRSIRAPAKRAVSDFPIGARSSNQLTVKDLTQIAQGDEVNDRLRQIIFVKGIKLNFFWSNSLQVPQFVNWAILQERYSTAPVSTVNVNLDFYRGSQTQRAVNFDNVSTAAHKHTYQINTDKYIIHGQGRFQAASIENLAYENGNNSSYRNIEQYIPINTRVNYESTSAASGTNPIFFVTWCTPFNNTSAAVQLSTCQSSLHTVVYYMEPY